MELLEHILAESAKQNVSLAVADGQLEVLFDDMPDDDLILLLKENKPEIIAFLEDQERQSTAGAEIQLSNAQMAPLSYAQKRMWFSQNLQPDTSHYNICHSLKFKGNVAKSTFAQTIRALIAKHVILRTLYDADEPVQQVAEDFVTPVEFIELAKMEPDETDRAVQDILSQAARQVFDLSKDLPIKVRLIEVAEQEFVVSFTFHHIAFDGWSLGLFVDEFCNTYTLLAEQRTVPAHSQDIQYIDFVYWQNDNLSALEPHIEYWTDLLKDAPEFHKLPLDAERPEFQNYGGTSLKQTIPPLMTGQINALCGELEITPFMLLLSAFSVFIGRWSSEKDMVIGTPVAGRTHMQLESMLGCFVNTLPLWMTLTDSDDFNSLLLRNKNVLVEGYSHQDAPFDVLVERLKPSREGNFAPIVQILFALHNQEQGTAELPGIEVEHLAQINPYAKAELELAVHSRSDTYDIEWHFATALFSRQTMNRMQESFHLLLAALLHQPEKSVFSHNLLPSVDKAIIDALATHQPLGNPVCLHEQFDRQAAAAPDAVALVYEQQRLSYVELQQRSNRLAHYLIDQGVVVDTLVGIALERSIDMVVAILAVLKAGGGYVPLDPSYPQNRLTYMLSDARVKLLVTESRHGALGEAGVQAICLDDAALLQQLAARSVDAPKVQVSPSNLAYVIYTSGSTGQPKGVMVEHGHVSRLMQSAQQHFDFNATDVWTLFHSYAFDFSVWEIWGALYHGGKLVVVPYWMSRSADEFYRLLQQQQVTVLNQTPSAFQAVIAEDERQLADLSLRYVIFGGEALSPTMLQSWVGRHGDEQPSLINMYGITETTVHVTYRRLSAQEIHTATGASVIGKPLADLGVVVLDSHGEPVPQGVPGEMYVTGAGVTRGYLHREALTASRFVTLNNLGGARAYRTGDLARYNPQGELEYLGRIDHQVKVRGFRIETGEIDHALLSHPQVTEAVVMALPHQGGHRLVGYVVHNLSGDNWQGTLNSHLVSYLPEHMVPSLLMALETMPLTVNGKVDRKALPSPDFSQQQTGYVAPTTDTEKQLCDIWQSVLGLEQVGVEDNFFVLGGHSLLAVELANTVKSTMGKEINTRHVFICPTVKTLAAEVEKASSTQTEAAIPVLNRDENPVIQASYAQQRLWMMERFKEGATEYNIFNYIPIRSGTNVDHIETAIEQIIERHESLRTTFIDSEQGLLQKVQTQWQFQLQRHTTWHLSFTEKEPFINDIIEQEQLTPFDLENDLMIRAIYIDAAGKGNEQQGVLLLSVHHIAFDGISVELFLQELATRYTALEAGKSAEYPPLPVSYIDYSAWQKQAIEQQDAASELEYWKTRLAGAPELHNFPLDHKRPPVQSSEGVIFTTVIGTETNQQIMELCKASKTSLFIFMQSLFALWVNRYSGSKDVVISSPDAGREHSALKNLVGFFSNNHLFRVMLEQNLSFGEYLEYCKVQYFQDKDNLHLPYDYLVKELNPQRSASFNPMAQLRFTLDNIKDDSSVISLGKNERELDHEFVTTSRFDLGLYAINHFDSIKLHWVGNKGIFTEQTLKVFSQSFSVLLQEVLQNPAQKIFDLAILTPEQQQTRLGWSKGNDGYYPKKMGLHQLFEASSQRFPQQLAVEDGDKRYSYEQLDAAADKLAGYLLDSEPLLTENDGQHPMVGIVMDRSAEAIVAILGVLKTGAAYVPIDPNYPKSRIDYLLSDSGVAQVISVKKWQGCFSADDVNCVYLDEQHYLDYLGTVKPEQIGAFDPNKPAAVLYTSGSTGKPKGVLMSHLGIIAYCYSGIAQYCHQEVVNAHWITHFTFGVSIPGIYIPLITGGRVQVLNQEMSPNDRWIQIIESPLPGIVRLTPAHIKTLEPLVNANYTSKQNHSFVIGGDQLCGLELSYLQRVFPEAKIYNHYGNTEVIVGCCLFDASNQVFEPYDTVPVGKPLENAQLFVLDENRQPVPAGVPGELYIHKSELALGYLNNEEATRQKFVAMSDETDSPIMFASGDIVKYLPDGDLQYLGRSDNQISLYGNRIEPAEIEHIMCTVPGVAEALVVAKKQPSGNLYLVAYFVPEVEDSQPLTEAMRAGLSKALPEYMVPSLFQTIDCIPLTPNGKVDRKALPEPDFQSLQEYMAPVNQVQQELCDMVSNMLALEKVGITDNFFRLGGNSLLSIKLMSQINLQYQVNLPVKTVFESPTVKQLSQALLGADQDKPQQVIKSRFKLAKEQEILEEIEL